MSVVVIYAPAAGPLELRAIEPTLRAMQQLVGGWVEAVPLTSMPGLFLHCNEEGSLKGLPPNRSVRGIVGDAFYARVDGAGELASVSLDDVAAIRSAHP